MTALCGAVGGGDGGDEGQQRPKWGHAGLRG